MMTEKLAELISELSDEKLSHGLYVVATDIGNKYDITLRALSVLAKVEWVICEERKTGSRLLNTYGIRKPIETLNEHNEKEKTEFLTEKLMTDKIAAALISDAGTPLFADPGNSLVNRCHHYNIPVRAVPGASSLMAALMVSGLPAKAENFMYYGFLPANKHERIKHLYTIKKKQQVNYIFLETPYRLPQFLRDMKKVLGSYRKGIIAYKITTPSEKLFYGTLTELLTMTAGLPKGEFVFILLAKNGGKRWR